MQGQASGAGGLGGYGDAARRVVLWRHGRTGWNAQRRFQGQTDIDLDETGVAQARRAAALLAALQPDAIVSSDLRRAAATAVELASLTRLEVSYDAGLRETFAGDWQGLTSDEIHERYGADVDKWDSGDPDVRPGGGETRLEVAARVVAAVERALPAVPAGGVLVVVTHGGAARVAIGRLLALPPTCWSVLGGLSNCCWSILSEGRLGWRLVEHNAGSLPTPVLNVEG